MNAYPVAFEDLRSRSSLKGNLVLLVSLAFLLRVGVRLVRGGEGYFTGGYSLFFSLAQGVATGMGFEIEGEPETFRVPFYSIVLAMVTMGNEAFLSVVILQSLFGAATTWCTFQLAKPRFGPSAALIAAAITAVYPYYVVHDTALGETSLFTLLTAVSLLLLSRATAGSARWATLSGIALGLAVMTRATLAPFALISPLGLAWLGQGSQSLRLRLALWSCLALAFTIAPWLVRSYLITGSATLTTETGFQLWNGNNENTFSHYPTRSIDRSAEVALATITTQERAHLERLGVVGTERWYANKAIEFIRQHPCLSLYRSLRKVGAAFGLLMSPRHDLSGNLAHGLSFGPVLALGLWGMWRRRAQWRQDAFIYALFVTFVGVTAVFFGHTSHRSHLDIYLIAFAGGRLEGLRKQHA